MFELAGYLERIGFAGPPRTNELTLSEIHELHMLHVPFENLDIHLGRRILLDEDAFYDKVVTARRGGFCYEMNGLFARVLEEIGFDVMRVAARVARADGSLGIEFDHMALIVRLGEEWLVDVGYGDSFRRPLKLRTEEPQTDPTGLYSVRQGERFAVQRQVDGVWKNEYVFAAQRQTLADFEPGCEYHQSSPLSSFTKNRICSRATPTGRITLTGDRLIKTHNGIRTEIMVPDHAWNTMLLEHFGITMPVTAEKMSHGEMSG